MPLYLPLNDPFIYASFVLLCLLVIIFLLLLLVIEPLSTRDVWASMPSIAKFSKPVWLDRRNRTCDKRGNEVNDDDTTMAPEDAEADDTDHLIENYLLDTAKILAPKGRGRESVFVEHFGMDDMPARWKGKARENGRKVRISEVVYQQSSKVEPEELELEEWEDQGEASRQRVSMNEVRVRELWLV